MTVITQENIDKYRSELANYPEAFDAMEIIGKWDGDLERAAKSIAISNGIEGVETNAGNWFQMMLIKIRDSSGICDPNKQAFIGGLINLIPFAAGILASQLGCPEKIATAVATPFAIYIKEVGIKDFCSDP